MNQGRPEANDARHHARTFAARAQFNFEISCTVGAKKRDGIAPVGRLRRSMK
jgi:hypothetical protein